MGSLVCLKMRTLCVNFLAPQKLAFVYSPLGIRTVVAMVEAHVMVFGRS